MKLTLKDYISIKIHKTDLELTNYIKSKLEPYNLAPEQNLIMMLLWEQDGITQNQLVECLNKDKTNVARMASNLESKGFINRLTCNDDRRAIRLYLTEAGKELGAKVIPIAEEFNEIVTNGITVEELLQLERVLSKITKNVQRLR
ncbi:MarR family winged helix-turn-helix transcriptional regulator [Anaerobacillus isosaccharinicus]|uniref:MarR family transcriptional regulator n=1 Tax=Anaerobacillus isosaccharinicus TaxID=1532552 RepID=A0A1S2LL80_9BACI|nr:MarR family transcriptional regulator [Anaerobacillus isosaccharinicus]MBA5586184.1 MarR family transcriptional regulator [Anaerobacillus isosaccharinicus]QOY35554.1 MarR family transcriptional regulator [Anaerobacillus isosaccharinicus]